MKKLFDWIVERAPQYKHLKDLYERELRDVEVIEVKINNIYEEIIILREDNQSIKKILQENTMLKEFNNVNLKRANNLEKQKEQTFKQLRKIRTYVNKLDKKDENVKEIKRLIKEML